MEEKNIVAPPTPSPLLEKHKKDIPPSPEGEASVPEPKTKETNESFLGSMLVVVLVLLLAGTTVFFGYFGFRLWQTSQAVENTPSIERMVVEKPVATPPTTPVEPETKPAEATPAPTAVAPADKATLEVRVLNGGVAKGVAGTYATKLRTAGYTKATASDAVGSYTGVSIFYAEGKEADAEALKTEVMKTYPSATIAKAVTTNKDSAIASLVVVLGQ